MGRSHRERPMIVYLGSAVRCSWMDWYSPEMRGKEIPACMRAAPS